MEKAAALGGKPVEKRRAVGMEEAMGSGQKGMRVLSMHAEIDQMGGTG